MSPLTRRKLSSNSVKKKTSQLSSQVRKWSLWLDSICCGWRVTGNIAFTLSLPTQTQGPVTTSSEWGIRFFKTRDKCFRSSHVFLKSKLTRGRYFLIPTTFTPGQVITISDFILVTKWEEKFPEKSSCSGVGVSDPLLQWAVPWSAGGGERRSPWPLVSLFSQKHK